MWPGAASNHRHADFQSQTDFRKINCINRLAGRPLQRMPHDARLCRTESRKTPARKLRLLHDYVDIQWSELLQVSTGPQIVRQVTMPISCTISNALFQAQSRKAPDWPGLIIFRAVARGLVISPPATGKQKISSLIYRGLARSRAAGNRRPMRGPNFPLAIFFDKHLRYSRPVITHSGATFRSH